MKNWQIYIPRHLSVDFVGCVCTEQDSLRSACTQPPCRFCNESSYFVPLPTCLEFVNLLLVQVVKNEWGICAVPVCVVHSLIDVPVVVDSGIPGSASNQAESLHLRGGRKLRRTLAVICL